MQKISNHPLDFATRKIQKGILYVLLAALIIIFILKWGLGTVRAVECLCNGTPGSGRLIDAIALSGFLVFGVFIIGFVILAATRHMVPPGAIRSRDAVGLNLLTGATWVFSLTFIRIIEEILIKIFPGLLDSPCASESGADESISLSRIMSGPSEEVWFAAVCAVLVLLTRKDLKSRFLIALVAGGVLRTSFHVYQGWASIGYLIWGGLVAVAIAFTGRWVILAVLHFIHNIAITQMGMASFDICLVMSMAIIVALVIFCQKRGVDSLSDLISELYPHRKPSEAELH